MPRKKKFGKNGTSSQQSILVENLLKDFLSPSPVPFTIRYMLVDGAGLTSALLLTTRSPISLSLSLPVKFFFFFFCPLYYTLCNVSEENINTTMVTVGAKNKTAHKNKHDLVFFFFFRTQICGEAKHK
jgi:hypothetical protein